MNVEQDRSRRAGNETLAVDQRRCRRFPHFRLHAPPLEHLTQQLRVALDVREIGAMIRNRHQLEKFANDLSLMAANEVADIGRLREMPVTR